MGGIRDEHIGNEKIHIPLDIAKEIRLADIIAASSCFPFGFEPINFPDDFIYPESDKLKNKDGLPQYTFDGDKINYPIVLMDGSIDDNQGTEAVIIAEERMQHYPDNLKHLCSDDDKAVDLYIISDVSPPAAENNYCSVFRQGELVWKTNIRCHEKFRYHKCFGRIAVTHLCFFFTTYKLNVIFFIGIWYPCRTDSHCTTYFF